MKLDCEEYSTPADVTLSCQMKKHAEVAEDIYTGQREQERLTVSLSLANLMARSKRKSIGEAMQARGRRFSH